MSKFGELLDEKKPLLLVFFSEYDELSSSLHPVLKDVAAALSGTQAMDQAEQTISEKHGEPIQF